MNTLPTRCPLCGGEIAVTRLYCHVETFIRCEGKISRMEDEIGLSYPTIRNRLHEVIRALGYEPGGGEEPVGLTDEERQRILEDLDKGVISADRAMQLLKES
jgi:hypothetical protein